MFASAQKNASFEALSSTVLADPAISAELSRANSIEEFVEIAMAYAHDCGVGISSEDIVLALRPSVHPEVVIGDAHLERAAGFGYGQYACTDNSNFTAQRPSACQTCTR